MISKRTNAKGYHPPELIPGTQCINCGLCTLLCPDFAIYIEDGGKHSPERIIPIQRQGSKDE
jgi:Pyruvate/2-oxoacid:ferredoxin oxidoreductase delta subunit